MTARHLFRSVRIVAAVAALAMTAAGCRVGSNYERPKLEPPAQFRGVTTPQAAESAADIPWWKVFEDPALQGLVRDGIASNLDLRVASARVMESRALAGIAKSYLYPEIGVGFGTRQEQVSRVGDPKASEAAVPDRTYSNWALNGTLSWEVDLFGRLRRGREAAFAQYLASEEGRRAVLVTLVSDIASTYFYVRELDLSLEIARRTVKTNDDTVVYYTRRLQGGVSNRLEVDQARANRAVTAAAIPDIERQIAIAENALSVLLGRPPGPIARGRALGERELPPHIPAGLPAGLLERRPDVVQAEQFLVAANANVGAAKALFYPTITLTGSAGAVSSSLSDFLTRNPVGHAFFSPADISWGPDTLVQPDVFVVAIEEARTLDWAKIRTLLLAVEVLSPSTARRDRFTKRRLYQEAGVRTYWIVDADTESVEIWTPDALFPQVVTDTLKWHPAGAAEPFTLLLEVLFRRL